MIFIGLKKPLNDLNLKLDSIDLPPLDSSTNESIRTISQNERFKKLIKNRIKEKRNKLESLDLSNVKESDNEQVCDLIFWS